MNVFLANEQELFADETRLSEVARHVLRSEGLDDGGIELSVLLVTADHIRELNARFANDDHATDVLAFPMMEDESDEGSLLGDVVVCPSVAQDNASRLGHSLSKELDTLVVHGTLHLLGYDHQNEDERVKMERRQNDLLESFTTSAV